MTTTQVIESVADLVVDRQISAGKLEAERCITIVRDAVRGFQQGISSGGKGSAFSVADVIDQATDLGQLIVFAIQEGWRP